MKRRWPLILIGSAIAGFLSWCCWEAFVFRSIEPHQGDGVFENLARRAGPFAINGYGVSMPEFDLGKPFEAESEYQVAGLLRLHRHCGVYLAIRDARFDRSATGGNLRLNATDSTGHSVLD
jgi:hypothetical protein